MIGNIKEKPKNLVNAGCSGKKKLILQRRTGDITIKDRYLYKRSRFSSMIGYGDVSVAHIGKVCAHTSSSVLS